MTEQECQNCKQNFVIDTQDFDFYNKMQVPAPTFCPQCRFQRRMMFRNESTLYRRNCDLCQQSVVSIFAPKKDLIVYCQKCWWSDKWDDGAIYLEYDPSKHIFEQMKELQKITPHMALVTEYSTLVNSEYTNHAGYQKNSFLVFNSDYSENCLYGSIVVNVKDSMDIFMVGESENIYEVFGAGTAYNVFYSEDISDSNNIYFSKDLQGCNDCIGCVGLRKKSYHIFNEQYTKEEYKAKLKAFGFDKHSNVEAMRHKAMDFWMKSPVRYMRGDTRNINVTGDYVWEAKNAKECFQSRRLEDSAYCQFITTAPATNMYDVTEWGGGADLCIDSITCGGGASNMKYNAICWNGNSYDVQYSSYCISSQNLFACMNLKKKSNRILNKAYSEDEFKQLRSKIMESMTNDPYVDAKGRVWKYGEFMPYDLSPFDYNETQAPDYFPLTKEEVLAQGWRWHDEQPSPHSVTLPAEDIPDSIDDVDESILKEILGCSSCSKPFKVVGPELQHLKRWGFPIPRACPRCRHMRRMARVNPYTFRQQQCMKEGYTNTFQTAYPSDAGYTIYCETCYQEEII